MSKRALAVLATLILPLTLIGCTRSQPAPVFNFTCARAQALTARDQPAKPEDFAQLQQLYDPQAENQSPPDCPLPLAWLDTDKRSTTYRSAVFCAFENPTCQNQVPPPGPGQQFLPDPIKNKGNVLTFDHFLLWQRGVGLRATPEDQVATVQVTNHSVSVATTKPDLRIYLVRIVAPDGRYQDTAASNEDPSHVKTQPQQPVAAVYVAISPDP